MISFFYKFSVFFVIKFHIIVSIALSYYLATIAVKMEYQKQFMKFNEINDSLYGVFKSSYDIFVKFKRELDLYERQLVSCSAFRNQYKIKIPSSSDIVVPKFGNLIVDLAVSGKFKRETIQKIKILYNGNACKSLTDSPQDLEYCQNYWSGLLLKGLEQSIVHIGVLYGTLINELQTLNTFDNPKPLFNIINKSSYIIYEQFTEYYLLRAFNQTTYIFQELREQKLYSIVMTFKYIFWSYILVSLMLFFLLFYFVYSYEQIVNSFMNFVVIFPLQYLLEDEGLYKKILLFGNNYY